MSASLLFLRSASGLSVSFSKSAWFPLSLADHLLLSLLIGSDFADVPVVRRLGWWLSHDLAGLAKFAWEEALVRSIAVRPCEGSYGGTGPAGQLVSPLCHCPLFSCGPPQRFR